MVFYEDTQGLSTVPMVRPTEDQAYLLVSEFRNIYNLDIKSFNYYMFEADLDKMSAGEFEWWYQNVFEKWVYEIEENYLDLEYETLSSSFQNTAEKKLFLKKIIHFIMFFFPYQILRDLIKMSSSVSDANELAQKLDNQSFLIELRNDIINSIEHNTIQVEDFVTALANFEKIAKKNLLDTSVELLDKHVKKQNFFLNIFKDIIKESDMEKIAALLSHYFEVDAANIG